MSDTPQDLSNIITSPNLPADAGMVHSPKAFSDGLTLDLTDSEIQQAFSITLRVKTKYEQIFRSKFGPHVSFTVEEAMRLVDQFEDELVTRLAEGLNLIASVDASPLFNDPPGPPIVDFIGALEGHYSARYGMDHEKKTWEVQKAKELGQPFLGADRIG